MSYIIPCNKNLSRKIGRESAEKGAFLHGETRLPPGWNACSTVVAGAVVPGGNVADGNQMLNFGFWAVP